jgi:2-polyprenyl-3-methyl-5-hydroxy-6-metoxy-1,4-benzoquinol methylase
MGYENRDCPCCNESSANSRVVKASSPRAEDLNFLELKEYWRGFRKKNVFFSYAKCRNCKLLYCPVYFTEEQLNELYSSMDDNTAGEEIQALNETQLNYVELASRLAGLSGPILELGGDIGLLTKNLLTKPEISSVTVIEPNREVHSSLKNVIADQGRVVAGWQELPTNSKYNAVVAVHVLDHLPNLKSDLVKIHEVLADEGRVFFVTHNEGSILRHILNKKWPPFCLQHPQLYRKSTIKSALLAVGFKRIKHKKTSNAVTVGHVVEVLGRLFGLKFKLNKSRIDLRINVRLGNIATVAHK